MNELTIDGIIRQGIGLAIRQFLPLVSNWAIWLATLIVPYLNMGTTVALWAGIPAKLSRGEDIGFTEVLDPSYRANLGDFFLTWGLMSVGIAAGSLLLIGPGCVLAAGWSQALPLSLEKGMNPVKAVVTSFVVTRGNKLAIFFANLGYWSIISLIGVGLAYLLGLLSPVLAVVVLLPGLVAAQALFIGLQAYTYQVLFQKL